MTSDLLCDAWARAENARRARWDEIGADFIASNPSLVVGHPPRRVARPYDPACETLARHFLGDPDQGTAEACDEHEFRIEALARHLQECVEDWLGPV